MLDLPRALDMKMSQFQVDIPARTNRHDLLYCLLIIDNLGISIVLMIVSPGRLAIANGPEKYVRRL